SGGTPNALTTTSKGAKSSVVKLKTPFSNTGTSGFSTFCEFRTIAVTSCPLFNASFKIKLPAFPVAPIIPIFIYFSSSLYGLYRKRTDLLQHRSVHSDLKPVNHKEKLPLNSSSKL